MAITKLTPTKMAINSPCTMLAATLVGADGMEVLFAGVDNKILIVNDTTSVATIKAGNSIQGTTDLELPIGKCIVVESGRFKNVSGVHKDTVFITGATAKITVIELP